MTSCVWEEIFDLTNTFSCSENLLHSDVDDIHSVLVTSASSSRPGYSLRSRVHAKEDDSEDEDKDEDFEGGEIVDLTGASPNSVILLHSDLDESTISNDDDSTPGVPGRSGNKEKAWNSCE